MLVTKLNEVPDNELDWLVTNLWSGVGIIGGEPKTRKTFIALDIATAVASGKPVSYGDRVFGVSRPGPVIYLAGEDKQDDLKRRLKEVPDQLYVSMDRPQLDTQQGKLDLISACGQVKPRLVVIDPLVRFHTSSENHVTPILSFLRALNTPVILVHHMKKGGTGGQGLRGSGDLHAWVDSAIYTLAHGMIQTEYRHAAGQIINTRSQPNKQYRAGSMLARYGKK